ncbi:hypothetical protein ABZ605_19310 [Streptomyces sp. NPDC012765]|uniref:hypothetical protein n=1 Tax=Streptomyces sp. NPDC012765 TaxID=3155249 RepID=UPI0033F6B947
MDSGISVTAVTTPALFTGPPGAPAQVVRVQIRRDRPAGPLYVSVHGAGLTTPHPRVLRAQRRAPDSTVEVAVRTGATAAYAALACAEGLLDNPAQTLDKAWRHLVHAAHHDAVTGTFSDQVYLDLLPTWREAYELAAAVPEEALAALTGAADTREPGRGPGPGPDLPAVTVHDPGSSRTC